MFASNDQRFAPVLGIDPGLTRCGYAVLRRFPERTKNAAEAEVLSMGVSRTEPNEPLANRLASIHLDIEALLHEFQPGSVAVEQVFFQSNVRTAMSVAQVSGVVLSLAVRAKCEVVQYTPSQVKNAIAGWGGADKEQVQKMVKLRLGLTSLPKPADAADAAALALCHLAMSTSLAGVNSRISQPLAAR